MATITLHPSGYDSTNSSYSSVSSSYPISNGYTDSSSTTYAYITCITGSRASTYISYTFDVSDIPASATIDSITCSAKVRVSSTSYISTATTQLYCGSTAKGSATTTRSTTATSYNLTPGTWTRSELDDIEVRFTGTRGTSNTTRSAYLYFYGATLTINYTVANPRTITTTLTGNGTIDPSGTQTMYDGDEYSLIIIPTNSSDPVSATKNGSAITLTHHAAGSHTASQVPSQEFTTGFSDSGVNFYMSSSSTGTDWLEYAIGHSAETPYSTSNTNNTYAKPSGDTAWINYHFDFSDIPDNATITSVTVKVYGARENSSIDSTHVARFQCYSGNTAKGSIQNFTSTSNSLVTVTNPGTWTAAELQDAQLRFEVGYYGGRMLGITWEVEYTSQEYYSYNYIVDGNATIAVTIGSSGGPTDQAWFKVNGTWKQVSQIYKKINGTWVLQTDYSAVFGSSTNYKT